MLLVVLERKNRDIFSQVTLVVEGLVTVKFHIKLQFSANSEGSSRIDSPSARPNILQFLLVHPMIGD